MNRRLLLKTAGFTAMGLAFSLPAMAKSDGKVGKLEATAFKKANQEAGAKVKALKLDDHALSEADRALVEEIALGGMMQLQASELAVKNAESADVKMLAEGEVEEQTVLAAKLKEAAAKKNIKLPTELNDKGRKLLADLKAAGDDFDGVYLKESGIKGHEELKKTMTKVRSEAKDPLLKSLAETALPLIEMHLTVSKDEAESLA
jgi:putative membrane protein